MEMAQQPLDIDAQEQEQAGSIALDEVLRFFLAAAKRHLALGICLGLTLAVLGITVGLTLPSLYGVRTKVQIAQSVTQGLANPDVHLPRADPGRGLSDLILRKENLEAIVADSNLDENWLKNRSWPLRLKDNVLALIRGPMSKADRIKALVDMLETRIIVTTEATGVTLEVLWSDADMAVRLANLTRERFLEDQKRRETSAITAAITILDSEVEKAARDLEPLLSKVDEVREKVSSKKEVPKAPEGDEDTARVKQTIVARKAKKAAVPPDPSLTIKLQEVRGAIRAVQEPWQRRLADLKLQLADLRGVFGPAHPSVVQQEARIREAQVEPPELADLRQKEAELLSKIQSAADSGGGTTVTRRVAVKPAAETVAAANETLDAIALESSPELAAARSKMMSALSKYNEFVSRLDAARLELTAAEAAFDYRYVVVVRPEVPKKPIKPNRPLLIIGSIVGAIAVGLLAGGVRELSTGRVIESWQVRRLGVPLLAEVDLSMELRQ